MKQQVPKYQRSLKALLSCIHFTKKKSFETLQLRDIWGLWKIYFAYFIIIYKNQKVNSKKANIFNRLPLGWGESAHHSPFKLFIWLTLLTNGWLNVRLSSLSHNALEFLVAINLVFRKMWEIATREDYEYVPKVYPKAVNTTFCSCNDLVFTQWYSSVLGTKFSKDSSLTCRTHLWNLWNFLSLFGWHWAQCIDGSGG